jgi:hypothetical protein
MILAAVHSSYSYASNNPLDWTDPSGLAPVTYDVTNNGPRGDSVAVNTRCAPFGAQNTAHWVTMFSAKGVKGPKFMGVALVHLYFIQRVIMEMTLTAGACKGLVTSRNCAGTTFTCDMNTLTYKAEFTEVLGIYYKSRPDNHSFDVSTSYMNWLEGMCQFKYNPCCGYTYKIVVTKKVTLGTASAAGQGHSSERSATANYKCGNNTFRDPEPEYPPTMPKREGKAKFPNPLIAPVYTSVRVIDATIGKCAGGKVDQKWTPYSEDNSSDKKD